MCQTLISYGANPQLEDEEGRTALDLATGKTREFLLKYHRLPKKKRHSLIRRFLTVMRPSKTSVVRCGPRRLCRSLGGCLIGLSGHPSLTDESEGSPVEKSPEAVKNEPEKKGEPKKSLAKNPAQGDAAPEKPEIGVQKPIYDSQGDEFHDALEEVNVTARKKKNSKSPAREPPVFAVPKLPSRPKRPPASETPLETTLEYLTCSEDEEDTIVIPRGSRS
ncbi:hypothetical protein L596_018194 [Steinernema carpocapsae]|nr:hypothetical protein L596_018194 [Steinernema carpocapsae]